MFLRKIKIKVKDLLVIGGGIDGAIANFYLSQNYDVVLVDKSRLGLGCTSCATALLEYQLDDFAGDLLEVMSSDEIVKAYRLGLDAVDKIEKFITMFDNHCDFARRPTFLYSYSIFLLLKVFLYNKNIIYFCLYKKQTNISEFGLFFCY